MSPKTFSLRGTYDIDDNALGQHHNIFDYVSSPRIYVRRLVAPMVSSASKHIYRPTHGHSPPSMR